MSQTPEERKQNETLVKQICKEQGLGERDTMVICATIFAESSFDNTLIHENNDGANLKKRWPVAYAKFVEAMGRKNSTDNFICQFNDFWWWYKDNTHRISPQQAGDIPTAVKLMIKTYLRGHLYEWYGYHSPNYYKYLKKGSL